MTNTLDQLTKIIRNLEKWQQDPQYFCVTLGIHRYEDLIRDLRCREEWTHYGFVFHGLSVIVSLGVKDDVLILNQSSHPRFMEDVE